MKFGVAISTLLALLALTIFTVWPGMVLAQSHSESHESESKIYTCSMHPQIAEDAPGECPICGMTLVRKMVGGTTNTPAQSANAPPEAENRERKIKHWIAPMDPTYISDKPGKSPMGMDLVPVYEDAGGGSVVKIDPTVVQNMGVRIKRVEEGTIYRHVRTIGTVEVAEDQLSVVNLRYSGWIERLYVNETGVQVTKGQKLFDIYSPELVSAQEEYLMALRSSGPSSPLAKSARARLSYWSIPQETLSQIEKQKTASATVTVVAPQTGYVLHKNVVQGSRVLAGVDLYRIGRLDRVWVNAEVYEFDAPWVQLGQRASMELSYVGGEPIEGTISYIHPTLNPKTRTLRVRLEFDNPELSLKPGMFATIEIEAQSKEGVVLVPAEAIIHSGTRQLVFVALELGRYEMREVTTGVVGDRYQTEVLSGLHEGERVVTSGQFLLDSESQLNEAVQKLLAKRLHSKDPAASSQAGHGDASGGPGDAQDTYWTCGMHPQVVEEGPGTCPLCGMNLIEKSS